MCLATTPTFARSIGDNAYICTEHLLTPFPGEQKNESSNDAYNFYWIQLRIRIEMRTFGRSFVHKWRIFRRPLQVSLKNVQKVFMCATTCRPHNFCISEGLSCDGVELASIQGNSVMRDFLVDKIKSNALSARPAHNLERNKTRRNLPNDDEELVE
jgi:hypothetical protein